MPLQQLLHELDILTYQLQLYGLSRSMNYDSLEVPQSCDQLLNRV